MSMSHPEKWTSKELKEERKKSCFQKWRHFCFLQPVYTFVLLAISFHSVTGIEDFSSTIIGRLLGYPEWCSTDVPCTLTLSCWFGGGSRIRGCGDGWFFSCCTSSRSNQVNKYHDGYDDRVAAHWAYQEDHPNQPHNGMESNSFRRRADDDASQSDCGIPASRILQKRIIGGRQARFAEFPWQAHVRISEYQCGGALVSRWFVATAAHCVSRARTSDISVVLGALDTTSNYAGNVIVIGVSQKYLHPLFQFRITQPDRFDVALLKLVRPVIFQNHILPICLPEMRINLNGRYGVIAGWGKTDSSFGHTGTNLLRSATVPILSREQCMHWHSIKQISVEIHAEMICAGHSDGHQDACLGDSGGPLIVLDSGRYILAGITSAGFGCGVDHQPGIYHNVVTSTAWIRSVINSSEKMRDNNVYDNFYKK